MNKALAEQAVYREINNMEPEMHVSTGGEFRVLGQDLEAKKVVARESLLEQVRVLESELRRTLDTPDFPTDL